MQLMWATSWILKSHAMCDLQVPPAWCVHRHFQSRHPTGFFKVVKTLLCLPVATEMVATSVLLGGDGATISFSMVVMSQHSVSHLSRLVVVLTEVTMTQYLYMEDALIIHVKTLA